MHVHAPTHNESTAKTLSLTLQEKGILTTDDLTVRGLPRDWEAGEQGSKDGHRTPLDRTSAASFLFSLSLASHVPRLRPCWLKGLTAHAATEPRHYVTCQGTLPLTALALVCIAYRVTTLLRSVHWVGPREARVRPEQRS